MLTTKLRGVSTAWRVLLVDGTSLKIVSSCVKMSDLAEANVSGACDETRDEMDRTTRGEKAPPADDDGETDDDARAGWMVSMAVVENVEVERAPQPTLDGVYFITPSERSVTRMIDDCKKKTYRRAHVFFTSPAPRSVLSAIKAQRECVSMLSNCSELNLEYMTVDPHGFSVGVDDALRKTFGEGSETSQAQARMMDVISTRLATVMVSLGEVPSVRFMAKVGDRRSDVSRGIADRLDRTIAALLRSKGAEAAKNNPTCDVLIVDRSIDVLAPIVHEWTYESMVTDLLNVPEGLYKYKITNSKGETEAKEAVLGENDPLWVELRHAHIAEVLNALADKAKTFANIGPGQGVGSRDLSTGQLKKAVETLPKVLEQKAKLSVHTAIASEINEVLQRCALSEVGRVEQDVVFGDATSKEIVALFNELDTQGVRLPMVEKLRLLLCYVSSHPNKIDASEKQRWMRETGLTQSDVDILENLELMGVKVLKTPSSGSYFSSSTKSSRPKVLERTGAGSDWDLFRFLPMVAGLVRELDAGTLDVNEFPHVGAAAGAAPQNATMMSPTKARSVRTRTESSWATQSSGGSWNEGDNDGASAGQHARTESTASNRSLSRSTSKRANRRLFVFVVGGMTRGELREARALSQLLHREVIFGSTSLETPTSFVQKLTQLTPAAPSVPRQYADIADLSGL